MQQTKLYGLAEFAQALGWDKRKLSTYVARGVMPAPYQQLASGPVWLGAQVDAYKDGGKGMVAMMREEAIGLVNATADKDLWTLEDRIPFAALPLPSGLLRYSENARFEIREILLHESFGAKDQEDCRYWTALAERVHVPGRAPNELYQDYVRRYFTGHTFPEGPSFASDPQCVQTLPLWKLDGLDWGQYAPVLDNDLCVFEVVHKDADREELARRGRLWDETANAFRYRR